MATPPRLRGFTRDSIPDLPAWMDRVILLLTNVFADISGALDKNLTRRENMRGDWSDVEFTTRTTVADTYPILVKNRMAPNRPSLVWGADLERDDGAIISDPWSVTWALGQSGDIELTFQGLRASTKYRARIAYE